MLIGLTGSIGCGKSAALKCFNNLNWEIFNSDYECHLIYEHDQEFKDKLLKRFGNSIFSNDKIDKNKISKIVFNNKTELQWLNSTLHPIIFKNLKTFYDNQNKRPVICEVPLLYECKWEYLFDYIITVWVDEKTQRERLQERGWSLNNITQRLKNQIDLNNKFNKADFVLIGNGNISYLQEQCSYLKKLMHPK